MNVGEVCTRRLATVGPEDTVFTAARMMVDQNVGTVFVESSEGVPHGVLTDRDIVLRCVAAERDPQTVEVSDLMSSPVRTVDGEAAIEDALALMSEESVRRLAVIGDNGHLVGVLALDDVLDVIAEDAASIANILKAGRPRLAPAV
ncbi:MAG: CBS domain-containing protein [Gemmatimonadota bacterium]